MNKQSILVEMMHGIGDTVCILPMLKRLREVHSDWAITCVVKPGYGKDILEASHILVDDIIELDVYKNLFNTYQFIRKLRERHYTYGLSSVVTPVNKSKIFMKLAGVKQHIGLQSRGQYIYDLDSHVHFVEAQIQAASDIIGDYTIDEGPRVYAQGVISKIVKREPGKTVVAVCIGNADSTFKNRWLRIGSVYPKGWGIDKINSLLTLLLDASYQIVLIGGKQELPLIDSLDPSSISNPHVSNFVGVCSIQETIDVLSQCHVSIGVDTGMQHVADALGLPTISIFGPTNPKRCGAYSDSARYVEHEESCKYCFGSDLYIDCLDRKCLLNISPNQVVEVLEAMNLQVDEVQS